MHLEHFPAGRVSVLAGRGQDLNAFHYELLCEAAHARTGLGVSPILAGWAEAGRALRCHCAPVQEGVDSVRDGG